MLITFLLWKRSRRLALYDRCEAQGRATAKTMIVFCVIIGFTLSAVPLPACVVKDVDLWQALAQVSTGQFLIINMAGHIGLRDCWQYCRVLVCSRGTRHNCIDRSASSLFFCVRRSGRQWSWQSLEQTQPTITVISGHADHDLTQ